MCIFYKHVNVKLINPPQWHRGWAGSVAVNNYEAVLATWRLSLYLASIQTPLKTFFFNLQFCDVFWCTWRLLATWMWNHKPSQPLCFYLQIIYFSLVLLMSLFQILSILSLSKRISTSSLSPALPPVCFWLSLSQITSLLSLKSWTAFISLLVIVFHCTSNLHLFQLLRLVCDVVIH